MANEQATCDTVLKGGVVIDPATGRNGRFDVGILAGRISAIEPTFETGGGTKVIDVAGKLVIAGMIDTHAHVYEHVTGKFGLNADMVGVRSATTTVIDQGGPSCMTIRGFRHFVAEPASSRVLAFISNYLVGGLEGHYYPELYGPGGVNVDHTVRAIHENRDIVKGVKSHAEIGGASRWGLEVVKLGQRIAREADVPLYIHLGQLWPTADNAAIDADAYMREFVPLMGEGDVLAHPFTRHPGGFVSEETGEVHPVIWEAIERGVVVDVGHGSHFSFDMARRTLDAGIRPFTLGADMHGYNVRMPQPGMSEEERTASPFAGIAPFNLTIAMTDLLALGLPLEEVVATVTANAAKLIRMEDELGSLAVGREADVTVLDVLKGRFQLSDNSGVDVVTDTLIRPAFCLRGGTRIDADSLLVPPAIEAAA